jgi:hypothetical protein
MGARFEVIDDVSIHDDVVAANYRTVRNLANTRGVRPPSGDGNVVRRNALGTPGGGK